MKLNRLFIAAVLFVATMAVSSGSVFAALLNVQPGFPQITFDSIGAVNPYGITFDPNTRIFNVTASPTTYVWASRKTIPLSGIRSLSIQGHLDSTGTLIPDQPGDQVIIVGDIIKSPLYPAYTGPDYSGTLLTGKITRLGFSNSGIPLATSTDSYDLRITPTGGVLFDLYKSGDIGITITSENSTFNGVFTAGFQGKVKGTVGVIAGPHIDLTETCTDAVGQGPIQFSATITNTGTENLQNITCNHSPDTTLSGVPTDLTYVGPSATATITGSYIPDGSPSTATLTCKATGFGSQVVISKNSSATCKVVATPAFKIDETCTNAAAPGQPITVQGVLTNTGNEILTGFSCSSGNGVTLDGIPSTLNIGATATVTGSYIPAVSNSDNIISCSAKGLLDNMTVTASASATCNIVTKPAFTIVDSCTDASAPGQPINISAVIENSGNEDLSGLTCSDTKGALVGVPTTLASGASVAVTSSYVPTESGSTDTITCNANGAINNAVVSGVSSATCNILTKPAFTLVDSCTDASAPGQPITISAVINNTGNEDLSGLACSNTKGALVGVPLTLASGASVTVTSSYVPTASGSTDTISCSANGAINSVAVAATSNATCNIKSAPALTVTDSCTDASAPGQPISISAVIKNSGNEDLSGLTCSDTKGALVGVPLTLASGASVTVTSSYVPTASGSTDTISCSASGAINSAAVAATSNATCNIKSAPALTVTDSCTDASAPGQPISISAVIKNSGNEDLSGLTCSNTKGALVGVPLTLASGASVTVTSSYVPTASGSTDTITCSASGAINNTPVSVSSSATCQILASIGDFVWNDLNRNGIQDTGEPGIAGITVNLYRVNNAIAISTSTTNANGFYLFSGLYPGDYNVQFALPTGYAFSPQAVGDNQLLDSNPNPANGTTPNVSIAGMNDLTIDAGMYKKPASIGNMVWNDLNKNGIQDAGEPGIPGVKIELYRNSDNVLIATTTTDASGKYSFLDLVPDTYYVQFYLPTSYAFSPVSKGGFEIDSDANVTTGKTLPVFLGAGVNDLTWDAGMYKTAIGCTYTQGYWKNHPEMWPVSSLTLGTVSYDKKQLLMIFGQPVKGNGLVSLAHQLIAAKLNQLSGASLTTEIQSIFTTADKLISGLIVPPIGSGNLDPSKTDLMTATLDTYNNGFAYGGPSHCEDTQAPPPNPPPVFCTGQIGNFIWNDLNSNGLQDQGEAALKEVTVNLKDQAGQLLQSTTSGIDGIYQLKGLCAGTYVVEVSTPAGFTPTPVCSSNLTGDNDSNCSPAMVTLDTNSSSIQNIDFGFVKEAASLNGCSLGYWKNHTSNWPAAYKPTGDFDGTFVVNAFTPNINLATSLGLGGGGLSKLARQGAAALLNASDSRLNFPMTVAEVIAAVKNAISSGKYEPLASKLDTYNNLGCPLN